jgi:ferrous iron transport protein A
VSEECDTHKVGIVLAAHGEPLQSDSLAFEAKRLAAGVQQCGGYRITEVGYNALTHPTIEDAIERAIERGAQKVIVVPAMFTPGSPERGMDIPSAVDTVQKQHPEVEIVYAGSPFDHDQQVALILNKVREYDKGAPPSVAEREGLVRLNMLESGDVGVVHDLRGGRGFMCRLAALGFTPGAEVRMIQNFGHGPLIVNIRDARIALGRKEARRVRVSRRFTSS